ncbi:MAG: S41 family peptidase, partial [Pseudomonadota bacterium]
MGGAVDHFGDLLWDNQPTVMLAVANEDGETREITADRLTFGDWRALDAGTGPAANFVDAVTFEPVGDHAGYLRIDTFVNYRRPVDPDDLYGPIFKRMADEGRDTLILDLRNNGGGSNDASSRLIAHLLKKPAQMKTDVRVKTLNLDGLRPHLSTWDQRALNPWRIMFRKNRDGSYSFRGWATSETNRIKPARHAFTGKLLILTSDENSSGSTNVIAVLAGLGRATLIGEPTGGSAEGTTAGILFTLTMPESGIRTRIPAIRDYNNVPSFESGLGVTPDIAAKMTAADWLAGNDVALIAAKAYAAR